MKKVKNARLFCEGGKWSW